MNSSKAKEAIVKPYSKDGRNVSLGSYDSIRKIEKSMGDGKKIPSKSEKKNISIVRKSLVARRFIKKGEKFNELNVIAKRPGIGLSPMKWKKIFGKKAKKDFKEDELIKL